MKIFRFDSSILLDSSKKKKKKNLLEYFPYTKKEKEKEKEKELNILNVMILNILKFITLTTK